MPNRYTRNRLSTTADEVTAAYRDDRQDELLDAAVTTAALIARADGSVEPIERGEMLDFLDRNGFLSVFTRAEILDAFACRVRQLEEQGAAGAALDDLKRLAGRSSERLIVETGERVAAADSCIHPAERGMLRLIFIALGRRPNIPLPSTA